MDLRFKIMVWAVFVVSLITTSVAWAQAEVEPEPERVGEFQIRVKTQPPQTISIDNFTLDPDEDKKLSAAPGVATPRRFFYRIRQEGYMAFDEEQWVNNIHFKMFNRPATQSQQYKGLAELLTDVNRSIKDFKETLNDYYQYGSRLIDFCNDPEFKSLNGLDSTIGVHLAHYNQLLKLRQSIANDLILLTGDVGCRDVAADYKKKLADLRGSMNKILAGSQSAGERYKELKIQTPPVSRDTQGAPATGTPPRTP